MCTVKIRDAVLHDASAFSQIYSYYVKNTAVSFEYEAPDEREFIQRIQAVQKDFPWLCLEADGKIAAYAYASKFHSRAAYAHCAELSIYIEESSRKKGFGRLLYEELERRLAKMGIRNLYACIATPEKEDEYLDNNSRLFHEHLGFALAGTFHKCGLKFGRWYNMIWMEKLLCES